mgnify:CR=1 FL=1
MFTKISESVYFLQLENRYLFLVLFLADLHIFILLNIIRFRGTTIILKNVKTCESTKKIAFQCSWLSALKCERIQF